MPSNHVKLEEFYFLYISAHILKVSNSGLFRKILPELGSDEGNFVKHMGNEPYFYNDL